METPPENVCPVASGMEQLQNVWREMVYALMVATSKFSQLLGTCLKDTSGSSYDVSSDYTTDVAVSSVVCSLTFLTIGVLLGAVGVYLTLRMRSRSSSHTSTAVMYEEVGVATRVKGSQDIQLTANEAYGPLHMNRHAHGQGKL